jgi:hypothetical protein
MKGIIEEAKKERAKYKETGNFWHNSILFDSDHYLDEKHKVLANQLFNSLKLKIGYKSEQKQKDFEILLANLLYQTKKPISISLNRNSWRKTKYNHVSYFIIDLIYYLQNKGLIQMKIGTNIKNEPPRITRIYATEKLLQAFPEYKTGVLMKPSELVILKDKKGILKDYKDTAETWRIRTILQRINDVNSKVDIKYNNSKLYANLVAIFIERFTWYGRLHTKGFRHYQGLSGDERKEIMINGDTTIELDFSGLHPYLLYASEGIQYSGDPYSILDKRPEARPFLKEILLCMLNAKDEITAERAANNWLYKNHSEREQLISIGITRARPLINRFFEIHKSIAHYFCKGKVTGLQIMNKDSKIALDVIDYFAKKNIPILSIHDSFIVQRQHRNKLYIVMKNVYQKHTGFTIKIK